MRRSTLTADHPPWLRISVHLQPGHPASPGRCLCVQNHDIAEFIKADKTCHRMKLCVVISVENQKLGKNGGEFDNGREPNFT